MSGTPPHPSPPGVVRTRATLDPGGGHEGFNPRAIAIGASVESLSYSVDLNRVGLRAMRRDAGAPRHLYGYSGRTLIKLLTTVTSGVLIGLTAVALGESIESLVLLRNGALKALLPEHGARGAGALRAVLPALGLQLVVSVAAAVGAAALVQLVAPKAAGAGVTLVMAHLNGNDIPDALTARTYVVKFLGNVAARVAGLALGPEGPMIHLGACVASCLCFWTHASRPSEACSHWSRNIGWRCFLAATVASFTLSQLHPRGRSGILGFGSISAPDNRQWLLQLPFIVLVSALGGLMGALFNTARGWLAGSRLKAPRGATPERLLEAGLVAAATTLATFAVSSLWGTCLTVPKEWDGALLMQYTCPAGQYNDLATILLSTSVYVIRNLLGMGSRAHPVPAACGLDRPCYFSLASLCIASALYLVLMVAAASTASPGGLFMPSIMVGATLGGAAGLALHALLPADFGIKPGIFAIVCATATLGGVFRSSISLVVIVVEGTQGIEFMFGIIVAVVISNAISQLLNRDGLYEGDLERDGTVFYLRHEPPHPLRYKTAADVMASPVLGFNAVESVARVLQVLQRTTHSGFAVYDDSSGRDPMLGSGRLAGLITRTQLMVLLRYRVYCDAAGRYLDPVPDPVLLEEWLAAEMAARQAARRSSNSLVQGGRRSAPQYADRLPSMLMEEADAAALLAALESQGVSEAPSEAEDGVEAHRGSGRGPARGATAGDSGGAGRELLGGDGGAAAREAPAGAGAPGFPRLPTAGLPDQKEWEYAPSRPGLRPSPSTVEVLARADPPQGAFLNLDPFMACAPLTVRTATPANEVHQLFLALSLRHLPVVDRRGIVWGMITRKDLDRAAGRGWWRVNNPPATPELGSPLAVRRPSPESPRNLLSSLMRRPRWLLAALTQDARARLGLSRHSSPDATDDEEAPGRVNIIRLAANANGERRGSPFA
ncbi:H(+)/Cl(-) exchange transporter 7 [Auxenochlorella protothecoides]|uniref:Chloride channel protein n=1 Tax=Auxenochlorella protothecoides TaxID=3075 RepID=A0A087SQ26_AUXPR|nr:H(+)/Cl(-) exchange transporter 7 [Auxenochlorella protothecoides]KFM27830.1 H(+)/Cl(-) exchange transporter 7 [Auxenochlorella protothecoides]